MEKYLRKQIRTSETDENLKCLHYLSANFKKTCIRTLGRGFDVKDYYKNGLDNKEIDGKVFKETDKDRSTKCKSVISDKLDICSRKSIGNHSVSFCNIL